MEHHNKNVSLCSLCFPGLAQTDMRSLFELNLLLLLQAPSTMESWSMNGQSLCVRTSVKSCFTWPPLNTLQGRVVHPPKRYWEMVISPSPQEDDSSRLYSEKRQHRTSLEDTAL
ncbi:unnamed protein product [Natator depressus]